MRLLVSSVLLVLIAASSATAQARMWVIRDADSTIYLLGTQHVLPAGINWRSPKIDAALKEATELWLETPDVDMSDKQNAELAFLFLTQGVSQDQRPLSERLPLADRALFLKAADAASGAMPLAALERLQPWAASMFLDMARMSAQGYDESLGVEVVLGRIAKAEGDAIKGLETMDQQIRMLSLLPEKGQLDMLREAITLTANEEARRTEAWARGDAAAIDKYVLDMKARAPELYELLAIKRNDSWADQIAALLKGSGVSFIAVGAAHLAGPDSLQQKLKAKGIEVADY